MNSSLDLSRLENVHGGEDKTLARCPACAEAGGDSEGEHLFLNSEGAFGCIKFPGPEGAEHRKRIFALVGLPSEQKTKSRSRLVATYDYHDENGLLVFQVCRYEPKDFRQRRSDGNGGWIWDMKGVERVLYRLPHVLSARGPVFLVEGEKDVAAMESLGLVATCNPGGAGKWQDNYTATLTDRQVIIIADKDSAGRNHAELVARKLHGKAKRILVVELPDRTGIPVKDAADWVKAGGTVTELKAITKSVPIWKPGVDTPETKPESFYYEKYRKEYLLRNQRGAWLALCESQFKKELISRGIAGSKDKTQVLSEVDQKLIYLRGFHDIDYAGRLAGHDEGFYDMSGQRVLVTESPKIIPPVSGDWPVLRQLLEGLFVDGEHDQMSYLMGWLKMAYESLCSHNYRPGQALVFCGPHNSGKSLFQNLITLMLGGRCAKPYQYMIDKTAFNAELFEAEHLCIEDEQTTTDIRARRAFGAQIKQITACDNQRCHAKGKQALTLTPFWRLTISVNEEPENLMVLPPIDDSISDKLIIFRCRSNPMPMPTTQHAERSVFWKTLVSELPAFIAYLASFHIDSALSSSRYGITHFHHPDILREIDSLAPECRMDTLINAELFSSELPLPWTGTAPALETRLATEGKFQHEARRLFTWNTACGVYLSRLSRKYPDRYSESRTKTARVWTIQPPQITPS